MVIVSSGGGAKSVMAMVVVVVVQSSLPVRDCCKHIVRTVSEQCPTNVRSLFGIVSNFVRTCGSGGSGMCIVDTASIKNFQR